VQCVFCRQERKATREHLYPDWVRQGIGATGATIVTRTKGTVQHRGKTTGLTWILRRSLCGDCNSGWMSTYLEDAVRDFLLPAMRGERIILDPPMQRRVAAWAVKTALLFGLKAREVGGQVTFAPQSSFDWLYSHRTDPEPPPGAQVWLAAVDARLGSKDALTGWNMVSTSLPPMDMQFYFVTFSVGYLVFQVTGREFGQAIPDAGAGEPILWRPDHLLEYVTAIWPPRSDIITWPPPGRLRGVEDLARFAAAEGTVAARLRAVGPR
jgi:hypothetical protein